jgi:hypothetical protein
MNKKEIQDKAKEIILSDNDLRQKISMLRLLKKEANDGKEKHAFQEALKTSPDWLIFSTAHANEIISITTRVQELSEAGIEAVDKK